MFSPSCSVYLLCFLDLIHNRWMISYFLGLYLPPGLILPLRNLVSVVCRGPPGPGEIHAMEWERGRDRHCTSSDAAGTASLLPLGKKARKKEAWPTFLCILNLLLRRQRQNSILELDCGGAVRATVVVFYVMHSMKWTELALSSQELQSYKEGYSVKHRQM